nr:hypothetical protein [Tanacetum cinerariifolium]
MSTPAYVDSETITQADGAQSSRVPVPLPDDPYVAVRQEYLVDTDTESQPIKAPLEADESQPLGSRVPLMGEEFEAIEPSTALSLSSFCKRYRSFYETPSPSSSLTLPVRKRYLGTSELIEDTKGESSGLDSERDGSDDESLNLDDERERKSHGLDDEGQGLEDKGPSIEDDEEAAPEGQQQAVLVVDTATSEPLGLGYKAARHRSLESTKEIAPSTYEISRMAGFILTFLTYVPPAAPVQTPLSPEWSPGSLLVSPSSLVVPSPIASPVATPAATISVDNGQFLEVGAKLELYGSILHDHTQRLDELPPILFEGYKRELKELYISAIWRSVLALEEWAGQTDAKRATLWHAIYDIQRENHDLRRQITEERHERLELTDYLARMERRQESGGE